MAAATSRAIGNYRLYEKIGSGGMGSVHLGRLFGSGGFRRIVAIKRLHPHFAEDLDFVGAFLDEARLASRIHHPNVVAPLDVVSNAGEVFLVFEHVLGVSLSLLARRAIETEDAIPPRIIASIMASVLHGLHAAHEARGDDGAPLGLIHRDVSPQNILVGKDGVARLLDFGIAKATGRSQVTAEGLIKGKRGYMAPEHLVGVTCRASDVYSASVVLWELLARRRLFPEAVSLGQRIEGFPVEAPTPSAGEIGDPAVHDALAMIAVRGLAHAAERRFATAREMAIAIEETGTSTTREVGDWIERSFAQELEERERLVSTTEARLDPPNGADASTPALEAIVPAGPSDGVTAIESATVGRNGKRTVRRALGALLFVAVLLFGVFLLSRRSAYPDATAEIAAPRASVPMPPLPFASAEPPDTTAAAPASAATLPSPGTAASGTVTASVPARPPAVHARAAAPKKPEPRCKPYVLDKDGRKQFNEACLR